MKSGKTLAEHTKRESSVSIYVEEDLCKGVWERIHNQTISMIFKNLKTKTTKPTATSSGKKPDPSVTTI